MCLVSSGLSSAEHRAASAKPFLQVDTALSSVPKNAGDTHEMILTEMAIATGRGDVRIMMGLPFSKTAVKKKKTKSLPDRLTMDRQRVYAMMDERRRQIGSARDL